jgi:hypothetical protein
MSNNTILFSDRPDNVDLFESEMNYLHENGFNVVTMEQVFGKN